MLIAASACEAPSDFASPSASSTRASRSAPSVATAVAAGRVIGSRVRGLVAGHSSSAPRGGRAAARAARGPVLASLPMGRSDDDEFEDEGPEQERAQAPEPRPPGPRRRARRAAAGRARRARLPDDVRDAVIDGRRITAHGARVRQRLYIGKLLRRIDVEPVRAALARRADADRERIQARARPRAVARAAARGRTGGLDGTRHARRPR